MDTEYRKAANITVILAGISLLVWIILKYALGALMPFLLAAIIAVLIAPLARKISAKAHLPLKLTSATLVIIIFAALSALISFSLSRLISETGELIDHFSENPEIIGGMIENALDRLNGGTLGLGFLRKILESEALRDLGINIDELIGGAVSSIVSSISSSLPVAAIEIFSRIPSAILSAVVLLISAFYFSVDKETICAAFISFLPQKWQKKLPTIKEKVQKTLIGYFKAYLLIMLITFAEMFVGLSILRVRYAFLLAMLIAVVDILPVLGTGTVLIPWAIFSFISSNLRLGIGLLVLYAVGLILRQLIEPKIIGTTLGLHPLATLASVYLALEFLGFIGIFVGPMVALLLKELFFPSPRASCGADTEISHSAHLPASKQKQE